MIDVQSQITIKRIKQKNRADRVTKSIFMGAGMLSASFIILIIVIVAIKGLLGTHGLYKLFLAHHKTRVMNDGARCGR